MAEGSQQPAVSDPRVRRQIQVWAQRLIDLTRRNRLLNFRPTRRGHLRVAEPAQAVLLQMLSGDKRSLPIRGSEPPGLSLDGPQPVAGWIVPSALPDLQIRDTLVAMSRRAQLEIEERGVNVLYVAFGVLSWTTIDEEEIRSPLLLLPASLDRESVKHPFELSWTGDDPTLNPALAARLQNDFQIHLPSTPDIDDLVANNGDGVLRILGEVQDAIKPHPFSVHDETWLGFYSFAKLVMYRDLLDHEPSVGNHPLVQAFSTGEPPPDEWRRPSTPLDQVDEVDDPLLTYSVLEADSSQRRALLAARKGTSFVMQGPPGTGKSQTIANLIAECMATGKSVLFVSEKMAALEVVHRRLVERRLDSFCLQLHSNKVNKRDVARALDDTLSHTLFPGYDRQRATDRLRTLGDRRKQLNAYAEALHAPDHDTGVSPFRLHAAIAKTLEVTGVPDLSPDDAARVQLDSTTLQHLRDLSGRLTATLREIEHHEPYPWRDYEADAFGAAELSDLQARCQSLSDTWKALDRACASVADELALAYRTEPDVFALAALPALLNGPASAGAGWLISRDFEDVSALVDRAARESERYFELHSELSSQYSGREPTESAATLERRRQAFESALQEIRPSNESVVQQAPRLAETGQIMEGLSHEIEAAAQELAVVLGCGAAPESIEQARRTLALARRCAIGPRPRAEWLLGPVANQLGSQLRGIAEPMASLQARLRAQRQVVRDGIFDEAIVSIASRFREAHGSLLARLGRQCREDRRAVRRHALRKLPSKRLPAIASEAAALWTAFADMRPLLTQVEVLSHEGPIDRDSDLGELLARVDTAECALEVGGPNRDHEILCRHVVEGLPETISRLWERLDSLFHRWDGVLAKCAADGNEATYLFSTSVESFEKLVWAVAQRLLSRRINLLRVLSETCSVLATMRSSPVNDPRVILDELKLLAELAEVIEWFQTRDVELKTALDVHFGGVATNWPAVRDAVRRADQLRTLLSGLGLSPVLDDVFRGIRASPGQLARIPELVLAWKDAKEMFAGAFGPRARTQEASAWTRLSREEAGARTVFLLQHVPSAGLWTEIRQTVSGLRELGWGTAGESAAWCSGAVALAAMERAIARACLDRIERCRPVLVQLTPAARDSLVDDFRVLDSESIALAAYRVIEMASARKPADGGALAGEVSVLRREAVKQRRHLPVRELLQRIPNLATVLKPCFLMSPLTVSQYLGPDFTFDIVVFDEASQVPPEDAIPAVYRCRQAIFAGDRHQLPPTSFFVALDDSAAMENLDEFESILDQATTIQLPESDLRWHYRSHDEALIAFSNHAFYRDRLVTFPNPDPSTRDLGVSLHHVRDGIYERGGSGRNRREAEEVVRLVFESLDARPDRSVGVVAFSLPQTEGIFDALELERNRRPEFEPYFSSNRREPVFVKNLENVQGDERDVIIFSIGYGRDANGHFTMHFGPLNQQGGPRRLNVAASRARQKIVVVTSVLASDFPPDPPSSGARLLRLYLEYAEKGPQVLRREVQQAQGDHESEFERSVAAAVRELGYEPVPQVGCSGYRIDLGIRQTGRAAFVLGVECDGFAYHSTPTARDRDRLRQKVLESFGWHIHRIWSTAWIRNRQYELERLRRAIEAACAVPQWVTPVAAGSAAATTEVNLERRANQFVDVNDSDAVPRWATVHRPAVAASPGIGRDVFYEPRGLRRCAELVSDLIKRDGPIHIDDLAWRIAVALGFAAVRRRIDLRIREAVESARRFRDLERRGDFLYPPGWAPTTVRVPAADAETRRPMAHVPPEEVHLAMRMLLQNAVGGLSDDDLITKTARVFGFARTGAEIRAILHKRLEETRQQER